jgi:cyclopropane fatty-acyl-phospholipid synthase-like methyltransferase
MTFKEKLFNNIVINSIAVFLRVDRFLKRANNYWKAYKIDTRKTHQEIAGYSHVDGVQEAVDATHEKLQNIADKFLKPGDNILDIGCGPGLYLKDFPANINKYGVDINDKMLELAKRNNPTATLYKSEFLTARVDIKFSMIYSVGMLQYISRSELKLFVDKIYDLLEKDGLVFISYPHATSRLDLFFPAINYISYSPKILNKIMADNFLLIQNVHVLDKRVIDKFDRMAYKSIIGGISKTYRNSSILIAQKKN